MSKNYLNTASSDKSIQNEQPEELIAIFGNSDIMIKSITTNAQHTLDGKENLILVNSNCTIILPRTILYRGEIAIKLNAMVTVIVRGKLSGETIDGNVTVILNTIGITVFGSDSKVWHIIQYK